MNKIPSVNLQEFLSEDLQLKQKFVSEIGHAYETIGFVALKGHFLDDSLVNSLYGEVKKFFDMPIEKKQQYEVPGIKEIHGEMWKGKADIVNHSERLIIDLKMTSDIAKFRYSASKYNYDSQAYIYNQLFGYEMIFMVIDKNTHQIKICDCSSSFYSKGQDKVQQAVAQYDLFFNTKDFDPHQYFKTETL